MMATLWSCSVHDVFRRQLLVSAGSLGCGVSGVVCTLIQA
jgi:hypothetical protein